jgi:hypothetical protein
MTNPYCLVTQKFQSPSNDLQESTMQGCRMVIERGLVPTKPLVSMGDVS